MPDDRDRALGQILTLDFTERLIRLDAFLRRAAGSARHQDAEVVASFLRAAAGIRIRARRLFDLFGRLWPLTEKGFLNAIKLITDCFIGLDRLHLQLSFIHVGWPTPEAYTFVSETCGPLLAAAGERVSIVLSDIYMFEETELGRYLGSIASGHDDEDPAVHTPALFLPKIEHENPLQWGILIHEIGHSLKWTSEPLLEGYPDPLLHTAESRVLLDNWAEEVVCDLLALHRLGPAYLVSFVSFINLMAPIAHPERATETHPDPRFRLSIMGGILERHKVRIPVSPSGVDLSEFYLGLFEKRCEALRRRDLQWPEPQNFPMDFTDFRDLLEEKAVELLPEGAREFPTLDEHHLQQLVTMLDKGIPIGGRAWMKGGIEQRVQSALADLSNLPPPGPHDAGDTRGQARTRMIQLLDTLGEEKSTVAEVLTAGWLYKTQVMYPRYSARLFEADASTFSGVELEFRDDVVRLDELLRKSIEVMPLFTRFGSSAEKELRLRSVNEESRE